MFETKKKAVLVGGLGFGDEGKGTTTEFLTGFYKAGVVIRYNGGAQAGHNVVLRDGRQHVFSQFGSGTFVPGVKTHLSRFVVVNPVSMFNEEKHLQRVGVTDAFQRTTIDEQATIVTPYHRIANQLAEISRGPNRHGSCGRGIGEAVSDRFKHRDKILLAGDLRDKNLIKDKLFFIRELKFDFISKLNLPDNQYVREILANLKSPILFRSHLIFYYEFSQRFGDIVDGSYLKELVKDGVVIFEGAQGILLDPVHGFKPHVTKTDITFTNAETLLKEIEYGGEIIKIGVLRAYATRHGVGPFPTEDKELTKLIPDPYNPTNEWQNEFRVGWFDAVNSKYAISCIDGVDGVAITNADRLIGISPIKVCVDNRDGKPIYVEFKKFDSMADLMKYLKFIQEIIQAQVIISSLGPRAEDKLVPYLVP